MCDIGTPQIAHWMQALNGAAFTITEIVVTLIRQIVAEILAGSDGNVTIGSADSPLPTTGV